MTSLLGVPIRLGSQRLGQIYLTDKIDGETFTEDDERVIETLAAYAAVAIYNARSYSELRERDRTLTRRNQDLALLNNLASALASITELDELLETALDRVMNYFKVEVGEIYLTDENMNTLYKTLHQGAAIPALWEKDRFKLNEGLVGKTAWDGQTALVSLPSDEDPLLMSDEAFAAGIRQVACYPLTSRSEVLGVLCIASNQNELLDTMTSNCSLQSPPGSAPPSRMSVSTFKAAAWLFWKSESGSAWTCMTVSSSPSMLLADA